MDDVAESTYRPPLLPLLFDFINLLISSHARTHKFIHKRVYHEQKPEKGTANEGKGFSRIFFSLET